MRPITHDALVKKAKRWLRRLGCVIIITEMTCGASEEADAIGWLSTYSVVIECKANRADFLGDKHKPHNRSWRESMGDKRYYLAPPGVIKTEELPDGHGLLELYGNGITIVEDAHFRKEKNHQAEITLLVSAMRRIDGITPKGANVSVSWYRNGWGEKARATLGIMVDK